ncbi:MAG TPA: hypothetical protein VFQ92_21540 [Blastocatellia bacterium]|nr:hypothetical protein [Blastocatellia bacterium]
MKLASLRGFATNILTAFALVPPTSGLPIQHEQPGEKIKWKKVEECIAGTPISRRRAARNLGFHCGRWVVAYFSAYCSDCDRAAVALKKTAEVERVLGVTLAPAESARKWKRELGLNYPVVSVSEKTSEELGAVILPTIVRFENGEAKGAYTHSGEKK